MGILYWTLVCPKRKPGLGRSLNRAKWQMLHPIEPDVWQSGSKRPRVVWAWVGLLETVMFKEKLPSLENFSEWRKCSSTLKFTSCYESKKNGLYFSQVRIFFKISGFVYLERTNYSKTIQFFSCPKTNSLFSLDREQILTWKQHWKFELVIG